MHMGEKMLDDIKVSDVSKFLKVDFVGRDFALNTICSLNNFKDKSICFVSNKNKQFDLQKKGLVIAIDGYKFEKNHQCSFIFTTNPRLDFIKVINNFITKDKNCSISKTAKIGKNCKIGTNVSIGEYCVIKDNVTIGNNTLINDNVVINSNTIIGDNCYIKSGAIIGEDGFGFERDENGVPLRFLHIGNVVIENNVEIGANCVIAKAALDSTIISDNVKIDDLVFVAHNVHIGKNTIITACSEISGSVKIGKNCWIGPNSTIRDGVCIGDNVFLGIASSISQDIKSNSKLGSISDLSFRKIVKFNQLIKNN